MRKGGGFPVTASRRRTISRGRTMHEDAVIDCRPQREDLPMLRRSAELVAKPLVLLAALTACALLVSGRPATTLCNEATVPRARLVTLPELAPQYTLQDGTILEDGQAKTADDGPPSVPGKVDTLDIKKAYDRAAKLSGQAK